LNLLWTPLHFASIRGNKEIVEILVNNGAEINATNDTCGTPLHISAEYGHFQIVESLLVFGADTNAKDNSVLKLLIYLRLFI